MIEISYVHKYYISMQNMEIILPYKMFKMSHIVFQLNKQNKVYLNASLYCSARKAKPLVLWHKCLCLLFFLALKNSQHVFEEEPLC